MSNENIILLSNIMFNFWTFSKDILKSPLLGLLTTTIKIIAISQAKKKRSCRFSTDRFS